MKTMHNGNENKVVKIIATPEPVLIVKRLPTSMCWQCAAEAAWM